MAKIMVNPKTLESVTINTPRNISSVEDALSKLSKADPKDRDGLGKLVKGLSRALQAEQREISLKDKGFVETKSQKVSQNAEAKVTTK